MAGPRSVKEIREANGGLDHLTDFDIAQHEFGRFNDVYQSFDSFAKDVGFETGGKWGNRLSASVDNWQAGLQGVAEAVGGSMGLGGTERIFGDLRRANEMEAQNARQLARSQGAITSFKEADSFSDYADLAGGLVVDSLPPLGEALVGGIAGRALLSGARLGLGRATAGSAGATAASYPSAVGDILQNQRDENGTTDLGSASLGGVPYALANGLFGIEGAIGRGSLARSGFAALDGLKDFGGAAARTAATAGRVGLSEGFSETSQELFNQSFGRMAVNPDETLFNPEANDRYMESFLGGALLGGLTGGAAGGWRRSEGYVDDSSKPTDLLGGNYNLTTDMGSLPPLQDRINQNLGLNLKGAPKDYDKIFDTAYNEPSGERLPDPQTGVERELSMGELREMDAEHYQEKIRRQFYTPATGTEISSLLGSAVDPLAGNLGGTLYNPQGGLTPAPAAPNLTPEQQAAVQAAQEVEASVEAERAEAARFGITKDSQVRLLADVKDTLGDSDPVEYGRLAGLIKAGRYGEVKQELKNAAAVAEQKKITQEANAAETEALTKAVQSNAAPQPPGLQIDLGADTGVPLEAGAIDAQTQDSVGRDQLAFNRWQELATEAAQYNLPLPIEWGDLREDQKALVAEIAATKEALTFADVDRVLNLPDSVKQQAVAEEQTTTDTASQQALGLQRKATAPTAPFVPAVEEQAAAPAAAVEPAAPVAVEDRPATPAAGTSPAAEAWKQVVAQAQALKIPVPPYESLRVDQQKRVEDLVAREQFNLAAANTVLAAPETKKPQPSAAGVNARLPEKQGDTNVQTDTSTDTASLGRPGGGQAAVQGNGAVPGQVGAGGGIQRASSGGEQARGEGSVASGVAVDGRGLKSQVRVRGEGEPARTSGGYEPRVEPAAQPVLGAESKSRPDVAPPADGKAVLKRMKVLSQLRPSDSNRPKDPKAAEIYDRRMGEFTAAIPERKELEAALLTALTSARSPKLLERLKKATGYDFAVDSDGTARLLQVNNAATVTQIAEEEVFQGGVAGRQLSTAEKKQVDKAKSAVSKQLTGLGFYQEVVDRLGTASDLKTYSDAELGINSSEEAAQAGVSTFNSAAEAKSNVSLSTAYPTRVKARVEAELVAVEKAGFSEASIKAAYANLSRLVYKSTDETAEGEVVQDAESEVVQDAESEVDDADYVDTSTKTNLYTAALAEYIADRMVVKKKQRTRVDTGDAKLTQDEIEQRKFNELQAAVDDLRALSGFPSFSEAIADWNDLRSDSTPEFDNLPTVRQAAWVASYKSFFQDLARGHITEDQFRSVVESEQRSFEAGAVFDQEAELERRVLARRSGAARPADAGSGGRGAAATQTEADANADVETRARARLKAAGYNVAKARLLDDELAWALKTYQGLNNTGKINEVRAEQQRRAAAAPAAETAKAVEQAPATPEAGTTAPAAEIVQTSTPAAETAQVGAVATEGVRADVASGNGSKTSSQSKAPPEEKSPATASGVSAVSGSDGPTTANRQQQSIGRRTTGQARGVDAAVVVEDLKQFLRKDALGHKVIVVQSVSDLPKGIKITSKKLTQGITIDAGPDGRVAYLIADNLTVGQIRPVFMHEVGSHMALDNMLRVPKMDALVDTLKQWAREGHAGSSKLEHKLALRAFDRARLAKVDPEHARSEALAYFIEEAVAAGINPTATKTSSPIALFVQRALELFAKGLRLLGANPDKLTAQDVVDMAYGAAQAEMYDSTPAATGVALNLANAKFSKAVPEHKTDYLKLAPSELADLASGVTNLVKDWTFTRGAFTRDLLEAATKLMPSASKYLDRMQRARVESVRLEREVAAILDDAAALSATERGTGEGSVNALIRDMTYDGKWAFTPDWLKGVTPDPVLEARFNQMSKEARDVVTRVFRHGYDTLKNVQQAATDSIKAEVDPLIAQARAEGDMKTVKELERAKVKADGKFRRLVAIRGGMPYAPLRRFGNWAVVVKSKMFQDAEADGDQDVLDKLRADGNHYRVEFVSNRLVAAGRANRLREVVGDSSVEFFERSDDALLYGGNSMFSAFTRFRKLAREKMEGEESKVAKALDVSLASMYMALVAETSARTSEFDRKNVAGADKDMLRSFATHGRAMAGFIGSLKTSGDVMDTLRIMKREASEGGNRAEKSTLYNEILRRHAMGLTYEPNQLLDKSLAANSYWSLITSPSYLLTNLTQPWVVSLPVLAGRFGMGRSSSEMFRAYKEIGRIASRLVDNQDAVKNLPKDVQGAVEELFNRGSIDISLGADLGSFTSGGSSKLSANMEKAIRFPRTLVERGEMVNRVATAVAAYRLAKSQRLSDEAAINYADKVIYETHGDYSAFNSPRVMRTSVGRFATQFRKYQLIQISMYARMIRDSFKDLPKGATEKEVKEAQEARYVARKALAYTLGTTFALGGVTALPGFAAISFLLGAFGDDDEPDDLEATMRRALGGGAEADFLMRGVPNLLGMNLGNRIGAGGMLSILPYTDLEASREGYKDIMLGVAGPFFGGTLPKALDGLGLISQGDLWKGLEMLAPRGVADLSKGWRFATEGVTKRNGDTVLSGDEVSFFAAAAQAMGLPTTTITDNQMLRNSQFTADEFYKERTGQLKRQYVQAYRSGDGAKLQEIRAEWQDTQQARRRLGFKVQPLSTLLKSPQEQRKREAKPLNTELVE